MPVITGEEEPTLNLTTLPPDLKREVWRIIQEEAPELASLLTTSAQTVSHFGGSLQVEHKHLPRRVLDITGEQS